MRQILCVEDEAPIREMIIFALRREGYNTEEADSGQQMFARISDQRPDLILLDWMLPDTDGPNLINQLRRDEYTRDIPIIMLTARSAENDMIRGLEAGADDYIKKPISIKALNARIKALLRRSEDFAQDNSLKFDSLTLDTTQPALLVGDTPINIGGTEWRLLKFLMQNPERIYTRSQLLDHVWGRNHALEERTVDVHVLRLRKILKAGGADHLIQTARGLGYKISNSS